MTNKTAMLELSNVQTSLLAEMKPDLREEATSALELLNKGDRAGVLSSYALGEAVVRWKKDPARYGSNAVAHMARFLTPSGNWESTAVMLGRLQNFATKYKSEDVKALLEQRTVQGRLLTLSHFLLLSDLDAKKREGYVQRILEEGLSVEHLQRELQANRGKQRGGKRVGRKPKAPKTVPALLQAMYELPASWGARSEVWQTCMASKILKAKPGELDNDAVLKMEAALEANQLLSKVVARDIATLEKCIGHAKKIVSKAPPKDEGEDAAPKKAKKKKLKKKVKKAKAAVTA